MFGTVMFTFTVCHHLKAKQNLQLKLYRFSHLCWTNSLAASLQQINGSLQAYQTSSHLHSISWTVQQNKEGNCVAQSSAEQKLLQIVIQSQEKQVTLDLLQNHSVKTKLDMTEKHRNAIYIYLKFIFVLSVT